MINSKKICSILLLLPFFVEGQTRQLSLEQAMQEASQHNLQVRSGMYQIDLQKTLQQTAGEIPKANFSWLGGQYNSYRFDNQLTFSQSIPHPTVFKKRADLLSEQRKNAENRLLITQAELHRQVKVVFYEWQWLHNQELLLTEELTRADAFVKAAQLRFKTGETNALESSTAESRQAEIQTQIIQNQANKRIAEKQLQNLLNTSEVVQPQALSVWKKVWNIALNDTALIAQHPLLQYLQQQIIIQQKTTALEKTSRLPDLSLAYNNLSLIGIQNIDGQEVFYGGDKRFHAVQVGIAFPLVGKAQKARIEASKTQEKIAETEWQLTQKNLRSQLEQAIQHYQNAQQSVAIYEQKNLSNAQLIQKTAQKAYEAGEIGYVEYAQALARAFGIRQQHLALLNTYNQAVIEIEFLVNQ